MNINKAKQIAEEMSISRTGFNIEVLARYMTPAEIQAFNKAYEEKLQRSGYTSNRFDSLKKEIDDSEKRIVTYYLDELDQTPVSKKETEFNIKHSTLSAKAGRIALRYLFQNRIKI